MAAKYIQVKIVLWYVLVFYKGVQQTKLTTALVTDKLTLLVVELWLRIRHLSNWPII